jgi:hypothetical protein
VRAVVSYYSLGATVEEAKVEGEKKFAQAIETDFGVEMEYAKMELSHAY